MGANGNNANAGDSDASTNVVVSKDSDGDEVNDDKDDITTKDGNKLMNVVFFIIPIDCQ